MRNTIKIFNFAFVSGGLVNANSLPNFFRGSDVQNVLQTSQVGTVCNVLRWINLLETHRPEQLLSVSVTLKLSRIMCVYLTGGSVIRYINYL